MSGLVFALALFGCSDDASWCERLSAEAQTFNSRVQCEMSAAQVFESDLVRRANYPTIIAKCMSRGQWAMLDSRPVNLAHPGIRLAQHGSEAGTWKP